MDYEQDHIAGLRKIEDRKDGRVQIYGKQREKFSSPGIQMMMFAYTADLTTEGSLPGLAGTTEAGRYCVNVHLTDGGTMDHGV
ncbi:hypothetical protein MPTK1_5g03820 [Marchantia polymorpha subsp. ruderalis]|uniref:Uncharacterized protein n=2 Tax=Marchantia polymorpha TaxID=3197 RepID=A0AAF6BEN8_MARPO|nr:hypothetical protein MARPO_0133s0007 [Marchantia polymorpha]BBN10472.1 hypothetical protein Mp_5g03820 [Marchantia polymorpha subsp. ruderalis]|eukprot:PTQ29854.1 hypothetical protein MARPO_0133s0007 [Marchantia polymorpha]